MLNVEAAKKELENKMIDEIHADTAWKWASRAVAAFQNCVETKDALKKANRYVEGKEYQSEAREHASQVSPELVLEVSHAMNTASIAAFLSFRNNGEKNV